MKVVTEFSLSRAKNKVSAYGDKNAILYTHETYVLIPPWNWNTVIFVEAIHSLSSIIKSSNILGSDNTH